MVEIISISVALVAAILILHVLYPRLEDRARHGRQHRDHHKAWPHPGFGISDGGDGSSDQQRAAHFPAYRSIRDLDQGRKLDVGDGSA